MGQKNLALLTRVFFTRKCRVVLPGAQNKMAVKRGDRITEVAVRWGFTVHVKPRMPNDYFTNETQHVCKFISINHGEKFLRMNDYPRICFVFHNNAPKAKLSQSIYTKEKSFHDIDTRQHKRVLSSELTRPLRQFPVCVVHLVLGAFHYTG